MLSYLSQILNQSTSRTSIHRPTSPISQKHTLQSMNLTTLHN